MVDGSWTSANHLFSPWSSTAPHCPIIAGSFAQLSSPWRSSHSPFNTRRSALRLARCSKVPVIGSLQESAALSFRPLTVPWWLRPFLLLMFHPALPFLFGLAVLADASTAYAIVSHQTFYFFAQLALFAASRGFVSAGLLLDSPIPRRTGSKWAI